MHPFEILSDLGLGLLGIKQDDGPGCSTSITSAVDISDVSSQTIRSLKPRGAYVMKRLVCLIGILIFPVIAVATSTIDLTNESAWGANIGWTNWRPDFDSTNTEGVIVGEFICSGYAYAANVGWINLGNGFTPSAGHIYYSNSSATDFGVNYTADPTQPGVGILRGFAYGANIGWINFEATGNPRVSLFTGTFSGYAYSANCGWINLNDLNGKVQTDHIAMGADSNGNGIADAWEYLYFGGLLAPGQQNAASPNGNGMTLLQDYQDGINPTVANAGLGITAFTTNAGGTSSSVTFTSTTSRLYTIEVNTDPSSMSLNWADSGLGLFAPDASPTTTRIVTQASATKRFYRVKTMRPLP